MFYTNTHVKVLNKISLISLNLLILNFTGGCQPQKLSAKVGIPEICKSLDEDYSDVSETMADALSWGRLGVITEKLEIILDTDGEEQVKDALAAVPECKARVESVMQYVVSYCQLTDAGKYCIIGAILPSTNGGQVQTTSRPLNNPSKHIPMLNKIFP